MANVAIVTDSSADLEPEQLSRWGIRQVPLIVSFGEESFTAGVELTNASFHARLTAPGTPFPRTAAPSSAAFEEAFRDAFADDATSIVVVVLSGSLSATLSHATAAAAPFPDADIRLFDSRTTSHQLGLLVLAAAELAAHGAEPDAILERLTDLRGRSRLYVMLDTLEYLKRGGRISAAQAAIGSVLSVKPIITIQAGMVETVDRPRTASRARERLLDLLSQGPVERAVVLHTLALDPDQFADELAERLGLARDLVGIGLVGPVAGAHVGPGAIGAAIVTARSV
jgi:DegV family protein with EDD domain